MPQPNRTILYALFESYLNIRTATWSLDSNNPAHSKLDSTADEKRSICAQTLILFRDAEKVQDWINVAYELYDMEQCQYKKSNNSWLGWANKIIGRERVPYLAETLRAARAYINSQLIDETEFKEKKYKLGKKMKTSSASIIENTKNIHVEGAITETRKSLILDKSRLAENKLKALECDPNYHKVYFTKIIKNYDSKSDELNEQSFDDFTANVSNNSRKNKLSLSLIKDIPEKKKSNKEKETNLSSAYRRQSSSTTPRVSSSSNKREIELLTPREIYPKTLKEKKKPTHKNPDLSFVPLESDEFFNIPTNHKGYY